MLSLLQQLQKGVGRNTQSANTMQTNTFPTEIENKQVIAHYKQLIAKRNTLTPAKNRVYPLPTSCSMYSEAYRLQSMSQGPVTKSIQRSVNESTYIAKFAMKEPSAQWTWNQSNRWIVSGCSYTLPNIKINVNTKEVAKQMTVMNCRSFRFHLECSA